QDVFLAHLQVRGELRYRRRAAEALGQVADGLGQRQLQLLQAPRHADGPALVPEMALDLADNGRRRIRGEFHAALQVEPVDGLDQPDRRDLGQVIEPLAAVAEPAGQVPDPREGPLHQPAADAQPVGVVHRQGREPLEELAGMAALPAPVLDPGRVGQDLDDLTRGGAGDVGDLAGAQARRGEPGGARKAEHGRVRPTRLARRGQAPWHRGWHGVELLRQGDLCLPRHADPDSRLLRMTIVSWSPGPVKASTLPASADSTIQAKVSLAGGVGARLRTDTDMVITSRPSAKLHSRSLPGIAWFSSIAHASSTAIRRSSISSRVKSIRAASPAVAA